MSFQIVYRPSTFSAAQLGSIDAECFPEEPMNAQALAAALEQDFWVAFCDGALAGFAHLMRRPDVSWLSRIGTARANRRRGVATSLLGAVLEHCAAIGLPETLLYVRTDNPGAIRLYERFGFRAVESSYQFILFDPQHSLSGDRTAGIVAQPITEVPATHLPEFPREWANIAALHRPPDTYVLIFREGQETFGYCRLSPGFPGCFPFVLDRPQERLLRALCSLKSYLRSDKSVLRLTFGGTPLADACRRAGLELSYEMLKMLRGLPQK